MPSNIVTIQPDESTTRTSTSTRTSSRPARRVSRDRQGRAGVRHGRPCRSAASRRWQLGKTDSRYAGAGRAQDAAVAAVRQDRPAAAATGGTTVGTRGGMPAGPRQRAGGRRAGGPRRQRWPAGDGAADNALPAAGRSRPSSTANSSRYVDVTDAGPADADRHRGGRRSVVHPGRADRLRQLAAALPDHSGHLDALPRRPRQRDAGDDAGGSRLVSPIGQQGQVGGGLGTGGSDPDDRYGAA